MSPIYPDGWAQRGPHSRWAPRTRPLCYGDGFYDLAFNQCKPAGAIERYVGDEYTQHNPLAANGKQAFIDYDTRMAQEYLGKHMHFERVIAEGNYVVQHCRHEWPGDKGWARDMPAG